LAIKIRQRADGRWQKGRVEGCGRGDGEDNYLELRAY